MRKSGVVAYVALLFWGATVSAGPLLDSSLSSNNNSIDFSLDKSAINCRNGTGVLCPESDGRVVGLIQNATSNFTGHLGVAGRTNRTCGLTLGTNVTLSANDSKGASGNHTAAACEVPLPTNVSSGNWSTGLCKNGTACFNTSTGSVYNGTLVTRSNTTKVNDTTGERMLSDAPTSSIDESADSNSSVCPPLVSREGWGGRSPVAVQKLKTPVPFVVIHHTYIPGACNTSADCEAKMRSMQASHMSKGWLNIGYNFLVGGDNRVYVGRGWDVVGAHSPTYNFKSVGICFIGDYRTELPTKEMIELAWSLIGCGVARGSISGSYKLVGHRQVRDTECPGDRLYQEIQAWPHWVQHRDIIPRTNTTASHVTAQEHLGVLLV